MPTELKRPLEATVKRLKNILDKAPVLWVDAGTSIAAGYPSTNRLVEMLREEAAKEEDEPIADDYTFEQVADAYVQIYSEGALSDLLQREIGPPRRPTEVHLSIARLAADGQLHTIITTNYDDVLERAFAEEGVHAVVQAKDLNETVTGGDIRLIKLHGTSDAWMKVVLSGQSYDEFERRYGFVLSQLDILLRQHWVLFIGCSMQDPRILKWLAEMPSDWEKAIKPWRALMTQESWDAVLAFQWSGGAAADALARGKFRALTLRDHGHLPELFRFDSTNSTTNSNLVEPAESDVADRFVLRGSQPFKRFGTVSGDHPSYVRRNSDHELKKLATEHVFIALEGPFQIGKSSLLEQHLVWLGSEWTVILPSFEFYQATNEASFNKAFFQELQQIDSRFKNWFTLRSILRHQRLAFLLDELAACKPNHSRALISRLYKLGSEHQQNVRVIATSRDRMTNYMSEIGLTNPRYHQIWETVKLAPFTRSDATQLFRCFPDPLPELLGSQMSEIEQRTRMDPNTLQRLCAHIWDQFRKEFVPISELDNYLVAFLNRFTR